MSELYESTIASVSKLSAPAFQKIAEAVREGVESDIFQPEDSEHVKAVEEESEIRQLLASLGDEEADFNAAGADDLANWSIFQHYLMEMSKRGWIELEWYDGRAGASVTRTELGKQFAPQDS